MPVKPPRVKRRTKPKANQDAPESKDRQPFHKVVIQLNTLIPVGMAADPKKGNINHRQLSQLKTNM